MATITIELSDAAYFLLQRWAEREKLVLDDGATQMMNRALAASLPEGLASWQELYSLTGSIKGWIASALLDDEGTLFTHTERLEILENADIECDKLRNLLRAVTLDRYQKSSEEKPTSVHDLIKAILNPPTRRKLADDPSYRMVVSALQNLCLSLLADVERLRLQHESFTAETRADLEVRLEEQAVRLQNLVQSLRETP